MMHPMPAPRTLAPAYVDRDRDFMLLTVFVCAQHGYFERARVLAEALYVIGDRSGDVLLARAVLRFLERQWRDALACLEELDRIDPIERFGAYTLTNPQRMRRYLRARSLYELEDRDRSSDVVDSYLRHGTDPRRIGTLREK
jgi:hypothetical protein